jgi:hypothetical protein
MKEGVQERREGGREGGREREKRKELGKEGERDIIAGFGVGEPRFRVLGLCFLPSVSLRGR